MVILHVELYSVLFIVVNDNEVTYHSQWNDTTIEEMHAKLSNAVQLLHSTHPQTQFYHLYISGDAELIADILPKIQNTLNIKINILQFFKEKIKVNPTIPFEKTSKLLENMLVCFGLALRKMPKW